MTQNITTNVLDLGAFEVLVVQYLPFLIVLNTEHH